jgi:hypothetical protein|nr:MAG TPA: hypothetical protein [Caudoviricetes sp.]
MANKLLPCICGGIGITIEAKPLEEELERWERHGLRPRTRYAVRCDKCGKQTKPYTLKTPAWKEWNRLNREKCKFKLFNSKQKAMVMRRITAMLKDARDECPNDETIKGYAEDLYNDILVAAEKGASDARKADKK